jgi:hypothetical protein
LLLDLGLPCPGGGAAGSPLREDKEPYTISGPTGLIRAVALEIG